MKSRKFLSLVVLLLTFCNQLAFAQKPIKTEIDSVSYAIGMDIAKNVKISFNEFNNDAFMQGFYNVLDSTNILLDEDLAQKVIKAYFKKKQDAAAVGLVEDAEENKLAGEAFLEENKSKKGVQTTASGLQYIVLKEGTGATPTANSNVKVNYHGTLVDGTVFDSSVDRRDPIDIGVSQAIPGWTEALQLMTVGSKYKFFIPQNLAYGARLNGPIPPYSTLIFEVELLKINE